MLGFQQKWDQATAKLNYANELLLDLVDGKYETLSQSQRVDRRALRDHWNVLSTNLADEKAKAQRVADSRENTPRYLQYSNSSSTCPDTLTLAVTVDDYKKILEQPIKPTKEQLAMQFQPTSINTIDGYVGQVYYNNKIVWQGKKAYNDKFKEGRVVESGQNRAIAAATAHIERRVRKLLED
jgi:hypothetical protein